MKESWIKASERKPERNGTYLVVITSGAGPYIELCDYNNKKKEFTCWDYYNDDIIIYEQEEVGYWIEVPEYKNLEK